MTNATSDPLLVGTGKDTAGKLVTLESRWQRWAPYFDQCPRRWGADFKGHKTEGRGAPLNHLLSSSVNLNLFQTN